MLSVDRRELRRQEEGERMEAQQSFDRGESVSAQEYDELAAEMAELEAACKDVRKLQARIVQLETALRQVMASDLPSGAATHIARSALNAPSATDH